MKKVSRNQALAAMTHNGSLLGRHRKKEEIGDAIDDSKKQMIKNPHTKKI